MTNSRMIHGPASRAVGDEQGAQEWYRQAKETKRGETGGGESQCLIVPLNQGNQPEGPWGGKGTPYHVSSPGNTPGTQSPESSHRTTMDRSGSEFMI
jgi:hypothetical protein